ncbi:hypothetical protein CA233_01800 [Sphingomonas sp. ABOLD]|nr:hypothetical protein CA234_14045 [Sphingomonas sp. ABOLE]RSV52435.1 hypothetical protein CA233_01800 [Sphingomonas sp. ABOLD]
MRRLFADEGLLCWRVLRLRHRSAARSTLLEAVCGQRGVTAMLMLRLFAAAMLVLPIGNGMRLAALVVIVLTGSMFKYRRWLSDDGSDQMGQTVAIGSALTSLGLIVSDPVLAFAGTLLIAGQLCIAYFIGGAAKLASPEWRSGRALIGVMGTCAFGHKTGARLASWSTASSLIFCWALMILEVGFPLALLAGGNFLIAVLLVFALFHLATAVFMGLNTYVWAFAAAFPCILIMDTVIASALGKS